MFPIMKSTRDILNDQWKKYTWMNTSPSTPSKRENSLFTMIVTRKRLEAIRKLITKPGVHSVIYMAAAGFQYTDDGDTVRCKHCGLEVSNWTVDMNPFTIHMEQNPDCSFVRSVRTPSLSYIPASSSTITVPNKMILNSEENPSKRRKLESMGLESLSNTFIETDLLQQIRRRTFYHWSHCTIPSSLQMINAGFFNCNVGDRVICLYCDLICEQWIPYVDEPCEIHKTLSPECKYVISKLIRSETPPILNINENSMKAINGRTSFMSNNTNSLRFSEYVHSTIQYNNHREVPIPSISFPTGLNDRILSINDIIQADFCYTVSKPDEICYHCNGSLKNQELQQKIQESKGAQEERSETNELKKTPGVDNMFYINLTTSVEQPWIFDKSTLSQFLVARLEKSSLQNLLNEHSKLSFNKLCRTCQLLLKHENLSFGLDLLIDYTIQQKQIDFIDGKNENIIKPNVKMKEIRKQIEREQKEILAQIQAAAKSTLRKNTSNNIDVGITILKSTITENQDEIKQETCATIDEYHQNISTSANLCVICLMVEKQIAFLPCGHFITCVPCGYSVQLCPICRQKIQSSVSIYI